MRRHRKLLLIAVLTMPVALTLSVYLLHSDAGPACRGHTLKEWLVIYSECKDAENLVRGGLVYVTPEDIQAADNCRLAREAIKQIGTKALPYLLRWIQSENRIDALALKLPDKIRRHQRLNPILFRSTTSADDADRAIMGFEALGPVALPALSELVRMTNDPKHPDTADRAVEAISYLGPQSATPRPGFSPSTAGSMNE